MASDPYDILGVKRDASQSEIQKSYRRLAKKFHPDLNPGNTEAERKFKEITAAYDLLSDAEKRARFDRGEIDASGAERPQQRYYRDFAGRGGPRDFSDFAGAEDIFSDLFGRAGQRSHRTMRMRGADIHYRIEVEFLDAVNGSKRTITLPDGSTLDVTIPPGVREGQVLRLRGKGGEGVGGGSAGDALLEISIRPHRLFTRDGDDIRIELPISLAEAVQGGKITVPTPTGAVTMNVPKWTNSGAVLRLKGKGVARAGGQRGDEYVTLKIVLPQNPDPALEEFVAQWKPAGAEDPRASMGV